MSYLAPHPEYASTRGSKNLTPQSDPTGSRRAADVTHTLYQPPNTKICKFFKDGDESVVPIKLTINQKYFHDVDVLKNELSKKQTMRSLPFGVRSIFTPRGRDMIHSLEQLEHDGQYICSTHRSYAHGLDLDRVSHSKPRAWHGGRAPSGRRSLNSLLKFSQSQRIYPRRPKKAWKPAEENNDNFQMPTLQTPKKVTVIRNGDPKERHVLLLNRKTISFEQVMEDLSSMFQMNCSKMYTMDGTPVSVSGKN